MSKWTVMRHISEGSEKECWYFPGFLCMCVQTQMLPTHTFTSLNHPLDLFTLFTTSYSSLFLGFLASFSFNSSLSLILYSSLSPSPFLPHLATFPCCFLPSLCPSLRLAPHLCLSSPPPLQFPSVALVKAA